MTTAELFDILVGNFNAKVTEDREVQNLLTVLRGRKSTQRDARRYAERLGELLGESFREVTSFYDLPGGVITKELADATVVPMLRRTHSSITEYANTAQKAAYETSGLGLNPVAAPFEGKTADMAAGLAQKVTDLTPEQARPWFSEPMVTIQEKIMDDWVRENAKAVRAAGFDAKIVRTLEGSPHDEGFPHGGYYKGRKSKVTRMVPCKWCQSLAGTYDYDTVSNRGNDVYRRHEGCRCSVTYIYGKRVEDVWTKKTASSTLVERLKHGLEGSDGSAKD